MNKLHTILLTILAAMLLFSASTIADDKTVVDGVMLVPTTSDPPIIDGVMDRIWDATTATLLYKYEDGPDDSAGVFSNHYSTGRILWDEDFMYFFFSVVDQYLYGDEKGSPWLNDCVELFFDGGNEKGASYDGNDIQWRWVYGEAVGDTGNAGNGPGEWVWMDTPNGYNLENYVKLSNRKI